MKTHILCFLAVVLASSPGASLRAQEVVTLPDPYLELAVRRALQLPSGTPVTKTALLDLTHLTWSGQICDDDGCSNYRIVNLKGLEEAKELKTLALGGSNSITDLKPIAGLASLESLNLDYSLKATGDALMQATQSIGSLGGLNSLMLGSDGLQDAHIAPLAALSNLQNLDLSQNPLTNVGPLQGMIQMQSLNLSGTKVSDLSPLKDLVQLRDLHLSQVPATDLAVLRNFASLRVLNLVGSPTRDISPIRNLEELEFLNLNGSQVSDLTPIRNGLKNMLTLHLAGSLVTDFSPLAEMQKLQSLTLGEVSLQTLPPLRRLNTLHTYTSDIGPLARLDQLVQLGVQGRAIDLTPLANLQHVPYLWAYPHFIDSLAPLATLQGFQPASNGLSWLALADLSLPVNVAALEHWYQSGKLSPSLSLPSAERWNPGHFVADGRLRSNLAQSVSTLPDLLQPGDLAGIEYIQVPGMRSLEGVQHARKLLRLDGFDGWIGDVGPLGQLPLTNTELDLSKNEIRDVGPLVNKPFKSLNLRGNPLNYATVPESWWTDPRIVMDARMLQDPQEKIPDPGLRAAIRLSLSLAPNASVQAGELQRLEYLYAERNGVRSLEGLQAAINLKGLALRNNALSELEPLQNLPLLQWIRTSGNALKPEAVAVLEALRGRGVRVDNDPAGRFLSSITPVGGVVYASAYQLSSIRYLQLFPGVQELFLSGNYLNSISHLADLPNLTRVHLEGNLLSAQAGSADQVVLTQLTARGVAVFAGEQRPEADTGVLIPDEALQRAIADSAALPFTPPRFSTSLLESVTDLNWERTYPVVRPPLLNPDLLKLLPNLTRLSLEDARLTNIGFAAALTQLTHLDLDFNRITDLKPIGGLINLIELDVNNNGLTDVAPLSGLANLLTLDLDENEIINIAPLASLTRLTQLDLHSNRITDLTALRPLRNLYELDLKKNHIGSLAPLADLPALQILKAQFNQLIFSPDDTAILETLKANGANVEVFPQFIPNPELVRTGNGLSLRWYGEAGRHYEINRSGNLKNWTFLGTMQGTGTDLTLPIETEVNSRQFFRVN